MWPNITLKDNISLMFDHTAYNQLLIFLHYINNKKLAAIKNKIKIYFFHDGYGRIKY